MSNQHEYSYAWAYRVRPEKVEEFLQLYGPKGSWVELFRKAEGYLGTELYRDREDTLRYVTIDHWASEEAYNEFRSTFTEEYAAIDQLGEDLTESESSIGTFSGIGHAIVKASSA